MNVEQQRPDPVVELARDAITLICEVPAWLLGGGEGVVRPRKDDFVEVALAKARRSVATARRACIDALIWLKLVDSPSFSPPKTNSVS